MSPHNRQSHRLRGYDYAQSGAYFVTISAYQSEHRFGDVVEGAMRLNTQGKIAFAEWSRTAMLRDTVRIEDFVVMPNHTHAIIIIDNERDSSARVGTGLARQARTPKFGQPISGALGTIVGAYKGAVTRQIHRLPNAPTGPVWHRNYHDHIIRHERDYHQIRRYIHENPSRWKSDTYYTT